MAQGLQDAYSNQSYQYGAAVISPTILINSSAVDSTIVSGGNTINSRWQTPIVITGATTTFSAALTAIPYNICTKLMLNNSLAQYITAIGITGGSMNTPPVLPTTAATACGASGTVNLTIDFIGHP